MDRINNTLDIEFQRQKLETPKFCNSPAINIYLMEINCSHTQSNLVNQMLVIAINVGKRLSIRFKILKQEYLSQQYSTHNFGRKQNVSQSLIRNIQIAGSPLLYRKGWH